MKRSTSHFNIYFFLGIICIITAWKLLSMLMNSGIIFPAPELVFSIFLKKIFTLSFWRNAGITALRVCEGFFISFFSGLFIGILCGKNKYIHSFLKPAISLTRVLPVMSVILIFVIWFDASIVPVLVPFLMTFPIITGAIIEGMNSLDSKLDEMAAVYGIMKKDKLLYIIIPQIFPFIIAGVHVSLGLTWKVVIAAEIISLPGLGIGSAMQNAQLNIETVDVFCWTAAAVIFSAVFDLIAKILLSALDWRKRSGQN
jgi:NitT/TauT family transport system permease protein